MKIGITGAGGQLGTALLRYALARTAGSNIAAITRAPQKLDAFPSTGIDARTGDFNQPAGLAAAFHGIERLVPFPPPT